MITFDKLKIVTSIKDLEDINIEAFRTERQEGKLYFAKYKRKSPYLLNITANYEHSTLEIEFTGKILLDNYPQLINRNNIGQCFNEINGLGLCHINADAIIEHGEVYKCDVTKDIASDKMGEIVRQTKQNIVNYSKWNCDKYGKDGLTIYKTAKTSRYKERLCIYDKGKEMEKACNRVFLNSLSNGNTIADYYNGKIRFELNLETGIKIRQLLQIKDNRLKSVLNSEANPILTVYEEAVQSTEENDKEGMKLQDCLRASFIRENDNDLKKVEIKVRSMMPKGTSITRAMKPFREVYAKMQKGAFNPVDVRSLIA